MDTKIPSRVPSALEIAGIVAAIVPFTFSMASTSMQTVNGQVTEFTYRDPVAIGGGIAAALCAVISIATSLRNTEPARRAIRAALCIALVAGGAFHVLRGFGIAGIDKPDVRAAPPTLPAIPVEPTEPAVDTAGATTTAQSIVALWSANKIDELFELAQPEVRKDFDVFDLRYVHDSFEESFGALEKTGTLSVNAREGVIEIEGPAVFAKATLALELTLVREGDKLLWRGLTFKIPEDLQRPPLAADGDAYARKVVDLLLAKKFEPALFHPRLVDRTPADLAQQLDGILGKLGAIKKIGDPVPRECNEARCVTFPIAGKKRSGSFEVDLSYAAYSWRVTRWNLTHE